MKVTRCLLESRVCLNEIVARCTNRSSLTIWIEDLLWARRRFTLNRLAPFCVCARADLHIVLVTHLFYILFQHHSNECRKQHWDQNIIRHNTAIDMPKQVHRGFGWSWWQTLVDNPIFFFFFFRINESRPAYGIGIIFCGGQGWCTVLSFVLGSSLEF